MTNDTGGKSEVGRLRELITLEYEAAQQGMHGFSLASRHEFISARQQNILHYMRDLAGIVGETEAARIAFESCLETES